MTALAKLADLLARLFEPAELRQALAADPETAALCRAIAWGRSAEAVGFDVAERLSARGLVGPALAVALRAHPDRAGEIAAVAAAFGVSLPSPPPPRGPVRVLHLSDLHASPETGWDAEPLVLRLADAVAALRADGHPPDLVALTGDVTRQGDPAGYPLAARWLRDELLPAAGVGPDRLLVVPGNHDLTRAGRGELVQALEGRLRAGPEDLVGRTLGQADAVAALRARYASYLAWLGDLGVAHPADPSWTWRTEIRGVSVRLAGLDTAWLHTDQAATGRLVLGKRALDAALAVRRDADHVVALAHHPLEWLTDWDQAAVQGAFERRADLLLRGHLHDVRHRRVASPHDDVLELAAGACYAGSDHPNSFQLVELGPQQTRVCVFAWRPERDAWVPDRTRHPPDGCFAWRRTAS